MCHFFLVFQFRILFFDLRFGTRDGFLKSWFEKDDISFTSWQFLAVFCHQTKVNVNHIVAPVKSHFLQNSFQLTEVVGLFLTYSIDVFHKVVSPCTVDSGCDITRDVKSGTVWFLNHSWWKVDIIQLNDASTLRLFQQAFFFKNLDSFIHLVIVESFSV